MSKLQRIGNIAIGLFMLFCAISMFISPRTGYSLAVFLLCITLVATGLRTLVYYFAMARHMVGGKTILYKGIILLDMGVFALTLANVPTLYIVAYLLLAYMIDGGISVLRARELKSYHSPTWKRTLVFGIISIAIAIIAVVSGLLMGSVNTIVYIYGAGLAYSAFVRIGSAVRRTAIVYIQ